MFWPKGKRTREWKYDGEKTLENSPWKNLVGFNAQVKGKKKKSVSTAGASGSYIIISRSFLLSTIFCFSTTQRHTLDAQPTHPRKVRAALSQLLIQALSSFKKDSPSLLRLYLHPHSRYSHPAVTTTVPGQFSRQTWGKQQSRFQDPLQPHAAVSRLEHSNSKLSN